MINTEEGTINLDDRGRILLPQRVRKLLTRQVHYYVEDETRTIVIEPVKSISEMRGSIPGLDLNGFLKEHRKER